MLSDIGDIQALVLLIRLRDSLLSHSVLNSAELLLLIRQWQQSFRIDMLQSLGGQQHMNL